jgi:hypothetical protein
MLYDSVTEVSEILLTLAFCISNYIYCKSSSCGFVPRNVEKHSLKIAKGYSECVSRRTDNTMAKRKRTKGQTTIYK